VRMDENELLKMCCGQILEVNEDVADRNQVGLKGWRKTQGNWVVEICARMPRIEVGGDIRLRRPRSTQGCRAEYDDDDDDDDDKYLSSTFNLLYSTTDGQSVYLDLQLHLVRFDSYIYIVKRRSFCREDRSYLSI